jgi:hypothetical protein
MSKIERLKKKVIVETIVVVVVMIICGVGTYILSDMSDEAKIDEAKLQGSINAVSGQINEEEKKIGVVRSSLEEFNFLKGRLDGELLSINRAKAEEILNNLRTKYRLTTFQATVAAEQPFVGEGYDNRTVDLTQSDIKIDFNAMSDLHVFSFVKELKEQLPGYVRIYDFSIRRAEQLKPEHFAAMSKGETPALVNAKISMMWMGIRLHPKPKEGDATATGAPAAPPPPPPVDED